MFVPQSGQSRQQSTLVGPGGWTISQHRCFFLVAACANYRRNWTEPLRGTDAYPSRMTPGSALRFRSRKAALPSEFPCSTHRSPPTPHRLRWTPALCEGSVDTRSLHLMPTPGHQKHQPSDSDHSESPRDAQENVRSTTRPPDATTTAYGHPGRWR